MSRRVVLVINHWGGIPACVHGNVVTSQSGWASCVHQNLMLSHTDPVWEFQSLIQDNLLDSVRMEGFRTVVLGATGLRSETRDDPRLSLSAQWGVDRCSLYDGALFASAPLAHDEEVLHEAQRMVGNDERDAPDLFLCVNLLSCRDACRPSAAVESKTAVDPRTVPSTLNCPLPTGVPTTEIKDGQFHAMVGASWATLQSLDLLCSRLLVKVIELGGAVALTASHALSLGERGICGGNAPIVTCCKTFWCSNVKTDDPAETASLHDAFLQFVNRSCSVHRSVPAVRCTFTATPSAVLVRAVVCVRERTYSCIACEYADDGPPLSILQVFALDEDPREERNVRAHIEHLAEELHTLVCNIVADSRFLGPVTRGTRRASGTTRSDSAPAAILAEPAQSLLPSMHAPPMQPSATPKVADSSSQHVLLPESSSIVSTASVRRARKEGSTVRRMETQLNLKHR